MHNPSDIDECVEGTHQCAQNCHNNIGSYTCSCDDGYRLNPDGFACDGELSNFSPLSQGISIKCMFMQTLMSVLRMLMGVVKSVPIMLARTAVAVTLDIVLTLMDTHAMVSNKYQLCCY